MEHFSGSKSGLDLRGKVSFKKIHLFFTLLGVPNKCHLIPWMVVIGHEPGQGIFPVKNELLWHDYQVAPSHETEIG